MNFKSLNIKNYLITCCLFILTLTFGQESHFSQVSKTPVLNNPANTAVMDEDVRVTNNYRSQWSKINIPYKTQHFGIEKKLVLWNQLFGLGINILSDFSNSNIIAHNAFSLAASYSRFFRNHQVTLGAQGGYVLKNFNTQQITFGSQWDEFNWQFSNDISSGENQLIENLDYFDFNLGILWRSKLKNLETLGGFSLHHLNTPSVSYINDNKKVEIPVRYTINGQVTIPLILQFDLTPVAYYSFMNGSHNFIAAGVLGYHLEDYQLVIDKVYGMSMFRINPSRNIDAFIVGGGIVFKSFDIGISYDINISALRKSTNFQGAFEVSLVFKLGKKSKTGSAAPCFML